MPSTIVIGAGCFGLSTAWHIAKREQLRQGSHTSTTDDDANTVLLLDRLPFPAAGSASVDTSRIVRTDYPDEIYAKLACEALEAWEQDPIVKQAFHKSGWVFAALPGNSFVKNARETLKKLGRDDGVETIDPQGVKQKFPGLDGVMPGWDMYFNPNAGWANASQALESVMSDYLRLGGKFLSGDQGEVSSLVMDPSNPRKSIGVKTKDGRTHLADKIIYCTGANTPHLVNTDNQIHPIGFCVAYWQLEPSELAVWKDHPIVDLSRHGYMFPPNEHGVMKMGVGMTAYSNRKEGELLSQLRSSAEYPNDGIPSEAEQNVRWILQQAAPSLANKPFVQKKICWDGFTGDGHWLITGHPSISGVYIAAAGSGHAFKFFPVIGKYVADLLEGKLQTDMAARWAWREGILDPRDAIQRRPIKDFVESLRVSEAANAAKL